MIPRSLVPFDARPSTLEPSQRRRPSTLDDRTLVPPGLAPTPLETKSNIPTNLPLESIAIRFVVPRDVKPEAYAAQETSGLPPQPSELDERITVPAGAASPEVVPPPSRVSDELVEKDVFLTGEVNFLAGVDVRERIASQNLWLNIILYSAVVLAEIIFILLIFLVPSLFRRHEPSAAEQEIARKQMTLLLPPGAFEPPRPEPRVAPPPKVKVDPRVLRKIAPPAPTPEPAPQPVQPKVAPKELPSAPTPQPNAAVPPPPAPTPKEQVQIPANPTPKLEAPDPQPANRGLVLPKDTSAGRAIEDSLKGSVGKIQAPRIGGGGQIPGGGSRGGRGADFGPVEMLTPTDGVDFRDYLARVYASVKRNWFAVMPPSVSLGDQGIVVLQFKIMQDGSVPSDEPNLLQTSQKEPLDRAAVSSVRASNPFGPLPSAYKRPYIELRFSYYYNIPIDYAK